MTEFMRAVLQNFTEFTPVEILIQIVVIGVFALAWYYLFWKPFDWYTDLTETGYDDINRSKKYNDVTKKNLINELRQKKKVAEVPPVYPNGWFAILESEELPQSGVKEVYALGLNLVAWRGTTGQSYVGDAYCPHMGSHLGVGGKVSGDCIECPFHGWKFQGSDGALQDIPYSEGCSLIGSKSAKINIRTTKEMNGLIFLWFHAEGEEPTWFPEVIPEIESKEWSYRGRIEFSVGCHVQEIPENGADLTHFNILHGPAVMRGAASEFSLFKWEFFKHVLNNEWQPSTKPGQKHVADVTLTTHFCLFNKFNMGSVRFDAKQCGPSIVIINFTTSFGCGVILHTVTPVAPLVQKVLHRFYSAKTLIHPIGKLILLGENIMLERDIRIWNRKIYAKNPLLAKEDQTIQSFRRWYSQFYSPNSPKLYFANANNNDNSNTSLEF